MLKSQARMQALPRIGCESLASYPMSLSLSFLFCKMDIIAPFQVIVKMHTAMGIVGAHIYQMK